MGFHTFECYNTITCKEYKSLKETFKTKGKFYEDKNTRYSYISEALSKSGIIIKVSQIDSHGYSHYILSYRINPRRVMEENNYVGIFSSTEVDEMLFTANKYITSVSKKLPSIYDCKISRIDYCYNIRLDIAEDVVQHLELLKRCNIPSGFHMELYYNEKAKKKTISKDGINLKRTNIAEISIYNKQRQMETSKKNYPEGNDASGIIRFEVQCFKDKVKNLQKKYDTYDIADFLNMSDEISPKLFTEYLSRMYGSGDFYKVDEAKAIINKSTYPATTKAIMIDLVDNTAKYKNLNKALTEFKQKHGTNKTNRIMKKFKNLELSPLTIPRRWDKDMIPNPLAYIEDEF